MSQQLGNVNLLDGQGAANGKPGQILGIPLLVEGTNKTGQVGTAEDIGRLIVNLRGRQIINADFSELAKMMDTRSGTSVLNSTDGGAFEASSFIPFYEEAFPSCLDINDKDELEVKIQPASNVATVFNALNMEIWDERAEFPEHYVYNIGIKNANYSGVVKTDPVQLGQPNVSTVYVDDEDNVLDTLSLEVDGEEAQSNASEFYLRAKTLRQNQIEDATFDFIKIPTFTPGRRNTYINSSSAAKITTSGAGNVKLIICSLGE